MGSEKYTFALFHINYREDGISSLIASDVIDTLSNIKNDLTNLTYLAYISDLTYQVIKHSGENLYNLLIPTIMKLESGLNPKVLTNILEIKYLNYLGIGLNLDSCIKCGSNKGIVTLDPDAGGYICSNCYRGELVMSPKAIKLIRLYYYVDINSLSKIDIKEDVYNEINSFIDRYYERYSGLYLNSKKFLNKIINDIA